MLFGGGGKCKCSEPLIKKVFFWGEWPIFGRESPPCLKQPLGNPAYLADIQHTGCKAILQL